MLYARISESESSIVVQILDMNIENPVLREVIFFKNEKRIRVASRKIRKIEMDKNTVVLELDNGLKYLLEKDDIYDYLELVSREPMKKAGKLLATLREVIGEETFSAEVYY